MTTLVLDSGAVTRLASPTRQSAGYIDELTADGLWPPVVPTAVVVECTSGRPGRDANTNRLLATCDIVERLPLGVARRAARLRHLAKAGSAVDAIVVALAEPSGYVLTGDLGDLSALAAHAADVTVVAI